MKYLLTFLTMLLCTGINHNTAYSDTTTNQPATTGTNTTGTTTANTNTTTANTTQPATTGTQPVAVTTPTNSAQLQQITLAPVDNKPAVPSMLDVNDEYTDIIKKIDTKMDEIISECNELGLKKPEILTGSQQQTDQLSATQQQAANAATTTNSSNTATDGTSGTTSAQETQDLVNIIVKFLGPDTEQQKKFFEDLALAYINANDKDASTNLDDAFVLDFLGNDNNFETHRLAIRDLTGKDENEELGISIDWDNVLTQISIVLDTAQQKRGIIVCENNRSYEIGIDVIVTAVAAVATFYTGGAGAAAATAGRAAIGAGLKAAAKAAAKVGAKSAAKNLSKSGGKQLAKSAVRQGLKANMRGWNNYAGKGVLQSGVKKFAKASLANLKTKWKLLLAGGATFWALDGAKTITSTAGGTGYSLISSSLDKEYLNCQDLDHNEGCYTVCGDSGGGKDDLNTKVFKPLLGKTYCVNPKDYALHEMNSNGSAGALMTIDGNKKSAILSKVKQTITDKGNCDYNEDDIDMYIGFFVYDPDTFEISKEAIVIDDAVRLDD